MLRRVAPDGTRTGGGQHFFLRPAQDIPYYCQEPWDGNGYPHKGGGDVLFGSAPIDPRVAEMFQAVGDMVD